jgi:Holliday junction resolvasome RuvABC endonuclease subunit
MMGKQADRFPSILAFDVATSTGWAFIGDAQLCKGSFLVHGEDWYERYVFMYERARQLIEEHKPDFIVMEAGVKLNAKVMFHLNSLRTCIMLAALHNQVGLLDAVSPSTIKKFITGGGKASKEDIMRATAKYRPMNSDEADAIALALYIVDVYEKGDNGQYDRTRNMANPQIRKKKKK